MYGKFAALYDELMADVDYKKWYMYIESIFDRFGKSPETVLEMACGTGNLSYYLAEAGYNLTCFDLSSEMLSIAYNKLNRFKNVNLLNQNMVDFKINKKFDSVISICDSINYILEDEDLLDTFRNVRNHLKDDGIFLFDINSYYKLKNVIGNNTFVEDRTSLFYVWQNYFDDEENIAKFYLTFFIEDGGGLYVRFDEEHIERAYHIDEIVKILKLASFKEIYYFDAFTFNEPNDYSERINFVAML
ncbi:MAG: class I SAM-dependent methyltransferase [Tissierellia bacterium]|nr:class I SAM-dependent methyltransferase [Tissierellia bacterium]